MTILVADDYETNRKLLAALLRRQGHDVHEARDGAEAVEFLKSAKPPVIALIDWEMPELPGIDVCRVARKMPHSEGIYLILATVRDSPEDLSAGFEAGVDDFLKKPFDTPEVTARMRVAVRVVKLEAALSRANRELESLRQNPRR